MATQPTPTNPSGQELSPRSSISTITLTTVQRMLFPDIATILALVVLFYALFANGAPSRLLGDSDTGWHILTGERILASGELPRTETYSYSKPGGAWYAWEWLAEIVMGWTHLHFGLTGIVLMTAVTIALNAWLWARFSRAVGGDPLFAGILMGLAMTCTSIHWLARPHVASWTFLILWLWMMERAPARFKWFHGIGLIAFIALWANIHASFFLAFLVAGAYALQYWFEDRARAVWVVLAAVCGAVGTLLNPYGLSLHAHLVKYLLNRDLQAQVMEYKSFNFQEDGAPVVMLLFVLSIAGAVLCAQQRQYARSLVILLCVAIAFRSVRGIPLLALIATPAVNAAFVVALRPVTWMKSFFEESGNFGKLERQSNGLAWLAGGLAGALWVLSLPAVSASVGFPPKRLPVEAASAVAKLPADARVLAPDYFGGYLIYRFNGERKVFMDGRNDYYGHQFVKDYITMFSVSPGWRPIFERYSFTHALMPPDFPLTDVLDHSGWRRLHTDKTAILFERPPGVQEPEHVQPAR